MLTLDKAGVRGHSSSALNTTMSAFSRYESVCGHLQQIDSLVIIMYAASHHHELIKIIFADL